MKNGELLMNLGITPAKLVGMRDMELLNWLNADAKTYRWSNIYHGVHDALYATCGRCGIKMQIGEYRKYCPKCGAKMEN